MEYYANYTDRFWEHALPWQYVCCTSAQETPGYIHTFAEDKRHSCDQVRRHMQVLDDWTFSRDRKRLQASMGPVVTSLLPESSRSVRLPKLQKEGTRLMLQILTNHSTYQLLLQMLLADRIQGLYGARGGAACDHI